MWGMSLSPMRSFLQNYVQELTGKVIVPLATNGGYGLGTSVENIRAYLPNNRFLEAYAVQGNKVDQDNASLQTWYQGLDFTQK
nr:flavodoxin [Psittacicella gerlachiana]